jgi:hypothetical protein
VLGLFQPFGRCCCVVVAASSTHVLVSVFLLFRSLNHAFCVVVGVVVSQCSPCCVVVSQFHPRILVCVIVVVDVCC